MQPLNHEHRDDDRTASEGVTITAQILTEAMSRVSLDADCSDIGYDFDTRFDDAGLESLQLAELIVELEEILGKQLSLVDVEAFETLGDLCRALRVTGTLH